MTTLMPLPDPEDINNNMEDTHHHIKNDPELTNMEMIGFYVLIVVAYAIIGVFSIFPK